MNLYFATVPIFTGHLKKVEGWLAKASAIAAAKKFDPEILMSARLSPDQYPFIRQIQAACDQAKFTVAKLAGKDAPSHPDTETTIAQLKERVAAVITYLGTFTEAEFAGAEDRPCKHTWMPAPMRGGDYLDHLALPNFHFHMTTAYAILRHNGIDLGKNDYLGEMPFMKG